MKTAEFCFFVLLVTATICGCTNAIYFYETEKVAINLEARPDGSQPITGNVGIKQRVAVVTPPRQADAQLTPSADSVSMISKFDLRTRPDPNDWNTIVIESTLLTGKAVTELSPGEAQEAYSALAGLTAESFTPAMATIAVLYDAITEAEPESEDEREKKRFRADKQEIVDALDLASKRILDDFPDMYIKYQWNAGAKDLSWTEAFGKAPGTVPDFRRLTYYRSGLKLSVESLAGLAAKMEDEDRFAFTIRGVGPVTDPATRAGIICDFKEQKALLEKLDAEIRAEISVAKAVSFFRNTLLGG